MISFNAFNNEYYRMFIPEKKRNKVLVTKDELQEDAHYNLMHGVLTYNTTLAVNTEYDTLSNSQLCETMLAYLDENKVQQIKSLGTEYRILVFYTIDNGHGTIIDNGCKVLIPSLKEAITLSEKPEENNLTYQYKYVLNGSIDFAHVRDVRNSMLIRKGRNDTFRFQINSIVVYADIIDEDDTTSIHYGHKHHPCKFPHKHPMPPKEEIDVPYGESDNRNGILHHSPIDDKCHHGLPPCKFHKRPPYPPYPKGPHFYDHCKNRGHHETDFRFHNTHFECEDLHHPHHFHKTNMNQFNAIIDNTHRGHSAIVNMIKSNSIMIYDSSKYISFAPVVSEGFEFIDRIRMCVNIVLHGGCVMSNPSIVDDILFGNTPVIESECSNCPYYPCACCPDNDPEESNPDDGSGDNTTPDDKENTGTETPPDENGDKGGSGSTSDTGDSTENGSNTGSEETPPLIGEGED